MFVLACTNFAKSQIPVFSNLYFLFLFCNFTHSLNNLWMLAVPVRMLLEDTRRANHSSVIACFADELQSDGKFVVGETARYRKRRQAAKVSNSPERIRKNKFGF